MKKLTKEKLYEIMDNFVAADSIYRELLPYLADEQQAEQRTKSEPSRLEVAQDKRERFWMDVWIAVASSSNVTGKDIPTLWANYALEGYDELIKQSRL